MQDIVKSDPVLLKKVMNAKPSDFREIIKQMLDGEQPNIVQTLHTLAQEDAKGYQTAIQGWAKFAHGTQTNQQVNVDVQTKQSMFASISEEYKYSEAIDAEIMQPDQLPSPEEIAEQQLIDDYNQSEEELKQQLGLFRDKK